MGGFVLGDFGLMTSVKSWLIESLLSFHSVMDSEPTQYAAPQPPKLPSSSNLFFPFSSFLKNLTGSCGVAGFVWPQHCPVFITSLTGYPVPLAPALLPGPYRNALGLVIAIVGAIELYG